MWVGSSPPPPLDWGVTTSMSSPGPNVGAKPLRVGAGDTELALSGLILAQRLHDPPADPAAIWNAPVVRGIECRSGALAVGTDGPAPVNTSVPPPRWVIATITPATAAA